MKRACIVLGLLLITAGCTPKVVVEVPKEPITFNINIKLDAEVQVITRGLLQTDTSLSGRVPVDLRRIDLEELLPLLGVNGLDGTGMLNGTVPLRISNGKLSISRGALRAGGPGRIRFAGPEIAKRLVVRPDDPDTVSKILADFHYRKLTLQLDKRPGDLGTVSLNMEGANPAAYDGRPAVFNIHIESDFKKFKTWCLPERSDLSGSAKARREMNRCGIVETR